MKLVGVMVLPFSEEPKAVNTVSVPDGSKFLFFKVLHDGIYAFYEVSEEVKSLRQDTFTLVKIGQSVPEGLEFVDAVDTIMQTPQGQAQIIFPIYKEKKQSILKSM